jgi:hypothetical protein
MTNCDECIKLRDEIVDLKHMLAVEKMAQADQKHMLNNYENLINELKHRIEGLEK